MRRFLLARLDNAGDVLLAGPAVRAAAAVGEVTLLCGPRGVDAAKLLPGVSEVTTFDAPWVGFDPEPLEGLRVQSLVADLRSRRFDAGAILTSFHQSPLPLALLLRMAGVGELAAVSVDYPGSLLDHRLPYRPELHEVEQALTVTRALGCPDPPDLRLAVSGYPASPVPGPYLVVHPGASVPARSLPSELAQATIEVLAGMGWRVVVTGMQGEGDPVPFGVDDLRGSTDFADLVSLIAGAEALVCGNTGPGHIAAAVGTPVVSIFAPVVPASRWRPWRVPHVLLGNQEIECAGCRSRSCPRSRQHCVADITAHDVLDALGRLIDLRPREPV